MQTFKVERIKNSIERSTAVLTFEDNNGIARRIEIDVPGNAIPPMFYGMQLIIDALNKVADELPDSDYR